MRILIGLCLFGSLQMYGMDSQDQVKRSPGREKASPRRATSPRDRERQKIEAAVTNPALPANRKKRLQSEENVKILIKRELQTSKNPDRDIPRTPDGKPSPKLTRILHS
jgi:hypothetical protein